MGPSPLPSIHSCVADTEFLAICRDCLWANLTQLGDCVNILRQSVVSRHPGPLNLYDIIHVSEAARNRCVAALAGQYSRLAAGRAVPQRLPIPNLGPSLRQQEYQERHRSTAAPKLPPTKEDRDPPVEFDRQTAVWSTTSSGPPVFQSEPPSPPLTPRLRPDDAHSPIGSTLGGGSAASEAGRGPPRSMPAAARRPNNSVFSMFCPEAMALQLDPARPVPSPRCRCGYRPPPASSSSPEEGKGGEAEAVVLLKDGFRMTRRFLAKSHCDRTTEDGGGGGAYGCVLCTSSGRAETYETAEMLGAHVNAEHTKWQMLHDRDMCVT